MEHDHTPRQPAEPKPQRRGRSAAISGAALGALVAVFAVLNAQSVEVNWIAASTKTPLIIVILVFLVIGYLCGALLGGRRRGGKR